MTGDGGGDDDCRERQRRGEDGVDEGVADPGAERFDLATLVDVLSHRTRRAALRELDARAGEVLTIGELAERIDGPCRVVDPLRRSVDRHERRRLQLYHVHVPKLAAEGLVTFDRAERTVAITDDGTEVARRL